jgi:hypothetical protein
MAVVVASREAPEVLWATVRALLDASQPPAVIDILVNGSPALSSQMLPLITSQPPHATAASRLRLWSLLLGDKAHAMNEYIHKIWPGAAPACFIDGYARVRADAPALLAQALADHPDALAAGGVPGSGRTAAALRSQMLREGGLHGNLFILGEQTLRALRSLPFRLPLGLYRTDATLGAALSFGLDPARNGWDPLRFIRIEDRARWDVDAKAWWRPAELRAQWRRRQRQAQGILENRSVQHLFAERQLSPSALPNTVQELVLGWQTQNPAGCRALLQRDRLVRSAIERLGAPADWSAAQTPPELLFDTSAAG